MRRFPHFVVAPAVVALAAIVSAPASSAIDLGGVWRIEYRDASAEFTDVTDVAGAVSFSLAAVPGLPPGSYAFAGTFNEGALSLSLTAPACAGVTCSLSARVLPDGDHFDGKLLRFSPLYIERVLANRCECFDGNMTDGDGCDATCRVEPCFTCTAPPSFCSPIPEGGACNDRSACTTGETCSAGVCEGTRVKPCVDLTGTWDTVNVSEFGTLESVKRIEQRETLVLLRDDATGAPQHLGTIVPATGVFDLLIPQLGVFCSGFDPMTGTANPNGQSHDASGGFSADVPGNCVGFGYTESGTRQCPGSPGCPPPAPAVPPALGLALAAMLLLATRIQRRRERSQASW